MNPEKKVINHFTYASEVYSKRKGSVHEEDFIILNFIKETCKANSKVLEVGGGSGYVLDLIASEIGLSNLYNCEIVPKVYSEQANKYINLIAGNALDMPFKDCSFDYAILKDLLHHLVGRTRKKSKENARKGVGEITRVVKSGGYIIVLEQYNKHKLFASVVFYITLFSSLFNISFKSFGWNKNVIVSFLTPDEIKLLIPDNILIERLEITRVKVPTRLELTLLMSNIGRVLLIGKKSAIRMAFYRRLLKNDTK